MSQVAPEWEHYVVPPEDPQPMRARATFVLTPSGPSLTSLSVGARVEISVTADGWAIELEALPHE